jgi:hypothetical protein
MVDPHDVLMTGENSFIRLSSDGSALSSADLHEQCLAARLLLHGVRG